MNEADEGLVLRSQAGDRAAFEELVRRTARPVFARVYLETGRAEGAEDLVQDTYLIAWRSVRQVTDPSGFRAWLFAIAHTVVIDAARREGRKKRTATRVVEPSDDGGGDPLDRLPGRTPAPPEIAERAEGRKRVLAILRSMPEEYRLPLTLRYLDDADYETIGRQLGITNGSLRGLLNRGMTLLRERVKRQD